MKLLFSLLAALFLSAPLANAAVLNWTAVLDGGQEVPPVVTAGSGTATGTIDTTTFDLTWDISFTGLTGPLTALHFHNAPAGVNGAVVVNIGAISGLGSPSIGMTTLTPALTSELLAGNFYINAHTIAFPGGEIRGQVNVVPLPATGALLLAALFGLGLTRRRT